MKWSDRIALCLFPFMWMSAVLADYLYERGNIGAGIISGLWMVCFIVGLPVIWRAIRPVFRYFGLALKTGHDYKVKTVWGYFLSEWQAVRPFFATRTWLGVMYIVAGIVTVALPVARFIFL